MIYISYDEISLEAAYNLLQTIGGFFDADKRCLCIRTMEY